MTLKQLRASLALHAKRRADALAKAARERKMIAKRKRQIKKYNSGPNAAIRWALDQKGTVEIPAFSNKGPKVTKWQAAFGDWLVGQAWCGVFVGTALRIGGVSVNGRVAGVALICEDAEKGVNGWESFTRDPSKAMKGDAVVLFGRGTHVGLVVSNDKVGRVLHTIEGNTSAGDTGSQANGGGVYARIRPYSAVYGIARPRYKS
jgi:hypothetical protein